MANQYGRINLQLIAINTYNFGINSREWKRNFSNMNSWIPSQRTRFQTDVLSTILFIKLVGYPAKSPGEYVRLRYLNGRWRAEETAGGKNRSGQNRGNYMQLGNILGCKNGVEFI